MLSVAEVRGWLPRFAGAIALGAAAEVLRTLASAYVTGSPLLLFVYFPAILAAALWLGFGPALACVGTCALALDWFWLPPVRSLAVATPADLQLLALFTASAVLTCFLVEHARRARAGRESQERRLEARSRQSDQAKAVARDREARLEAILDTAVDAILTIDERGVIDSANAAVETMFGYSAAEIVGQNVSVLMPSPYREEHDGYIQAYMRTGVKRIIGIGREVLGLRKDGTTFPIHLAVSEVHVEGARRFTGFIRDLTEQKRLEREFLQSQKMEVIARLASGVAHDFNNLLAGIIGCSGLAKKRLAADHPAWEFVAEIYSAAERGAALSRQLLTFGRQQPGEARAIDVDAIVRALERMLRQMIGEDIAIELALSGSGGLVVGDPTRIEQIVMNLAVNARDAMPDGGRLSIATRELAIDQALHTRSGELPPGEYVVLEVRDDGCGMDEPTLERVFEPFFTTKEAGRGTGLGLFTVYGIVKQMRGAVDLESRPGRGTKFSVFFPRSERKAPSSSETSRASSSSLVGHETILVVEDERLIRETLSRMLAELGYRVLTADRPDEALRIVRTHDGSLDLVLTDMVMPGFNGAELARRLSVERPGVKVILMSAFPGEILASQGRVEAGTITLEKPFDETTLAGAIRSALDGSPR